MPRQPIQVLVIPFRIRDAGPEYCVLRRSDDSSWQFVAGGVDDGETPLDAAKREAFEEAGTPVASRIITLDSMATMPANIFRDWKHWPQGTYVVKEFAFAIEVPGEITLGREHTEYKWCADEEARGLLRYDSNKTALWELSQRLKERKR